MEKMTWEQLLAYAPRDMTGGYDTSGGATKVNVPGLGQVLFYFNDYSTTPTQAAVINPDGSETKLEPTKDGRISQKSFTAEEVNKASTNDSWISKYGWMVPLGMAGGIGSLSGNSLFGAGATSTDAAMANLANVGGMGSGSELVGGAIGAGELGGTAALETAGLGGATAAGAQTIPAVTNSVIPSLVSPPAVPATAPPATPPIEPLDPYPLTPDGNALPPVEAGTSPIPPVSPAVPAAPATSSVITPAATAGGSLIPGIPNSVIPAVVGAVAGGVGANSTPAGVTTTVQDLPDWLKPYVQNNLNAAQSYMTANPQDNSLLAPATAQMAKTIGGDYLGANPWLDATFQKAADAVGANIDSRFSKAGRFGSGSLASTLGTNFNNLATDIYGGNYEKERARQVAAATAAPDFTTAAGSSPFAAFNAFGNLTKQNVSSTSTPYFTNPTAGALSGALAGYGLSKAFA